MTKLILTICFLAFADGFMLDPWSNDFDCSKDWDQVTAKCANETVCKSDTRCMVKRAECYEENWKNVTKPCQDAVTTGMKCSHCVPEMKAANASCNAWEVKMCPKAKTGGQKWECFLDHKSCAPKNCSRDAGTAFACSAVHEAELDCFKSNHNRTIKACAADIKKFCPKAKTSSAIKKCVQKNLKKMSKRCQGAIKKYGKCIQCEEAKFVDIYECSEDMSRICRGKLTPQTQIACLVLNWFKFNPECRKAAKWSMLACRDSKKTCRTVDECVKAAEKVAHDAEQLANKTANDVMHWLKNITARHYTTAAAVGIRDGFHHQQWIGGDDHDYVAHGHVANGQEKWKGPTCSREFDAMLKDCGDQLDLAIQLCIDPKYGMGMGQPFSMTWNSCVVSHRANFTDKCYQRMFEASKCHADPSRTHKVQKYKPSYQGGPNHAFNWDLYAHQKAQIVRPAMRAVDPTDYAKEAERAGMFSLSIIVVVCFAFAILCFCVACYYANRAHAEETQKVYVEVPLMEVPMMKWPSGTFEQLIRDMEMDERARRFFPEGEEAYYLDDFHAPRTAFDKV